jgi:hypothetical protein
MQSLNFYELTCELSFVASTVASIVQVAKQAHAEESLRSKKVAQLLTKFPILYSNKSQPLHLATF